MNLEFRYIGDGQWCALTRGILFQITDEDIGFIMDIFDESGKAIHFRGRKKQFGTYQHAVDAADKWYAKYVLSDEEE